MFDRRVFLMRASAAAAGTVIYNTGIASANAATTKWTDWKTAVYGAPGAVNGVLQLTSSKKINVSYKGSLYYAYLNNTFPSWLPKSTFSGGLVKNSPNIKDMIALTGGAGTGISTIKFSAPIKNPVMSIWSLGQPSFPATFHFNSKLSFSIVSGGPSIEYGGKSITAKKNVVSGFEGNGTILFRGPLSELSWACPNYEGYYGFTIGAF